MRRSPKKSTGVTLIELIIGIAILGVLLAAAMPNFAVWKENAKTKQEAESVLDGLNKARWEAIHHPKADAYVAFTLLGTGTNWKVGCVPESATCPDVIDSHTRSEAHEMVGWNWKNWIVLVRPNGETVYAFNATGQLTEPAPIAGGTITTIDVVNSNPALSAADARDLRITIDVGGAIRMCDPKVSAPNPRAC